MDKKKKCLIIGPGDLGQRIAKKMHDLDYRVYTINRNITRLSSDYCRIAFDFTSKQMELSLDINFDCIFFTAAPDTHTTESYKSIYLESVQKLSGILKRSKYFIFASSTSVYHQNNTETVDEQSTTLPQKFSGQILLQAENWVREHIKKHVIVRLSGLYSQDRNPVAKLLDAQTKFSWDRISNRIHLEDAANIFVFLCQSPAHEKIFIGTDSHPSPYWDIGKWVFKQHNKAWPHPVPQKLSNKYLSNKLLMSKGFSFVYPSYKEGLKTCL